MEKDSNTKGEKELTNYTIKYVENNGVSVDSFGVIGNSITNAGITQNPNLEMEMVGYDDTRAFQAAIDYCIANKKRLVLNGNKKYRIRDTLVIEGKLSIEGNYATIFADIEDKEKPLFICMGNSQEKISNLHLIGNYICKAAIEFKQPDNQMLTLINLDIGYFRYGLYADEAEVLNRMVIDRCEILNNLLSGIYFKSSQIGPYELGQSVPVRINDTILHTNGFGDMAENGYVNRQKIITKEKRSDVHQIYLVGIGNLLITGGQLTGGTENATGSLLWGYRVSQLTMIDVETEQFCLAEENSNKKMDESRYVEYTGKKYGGAIHLEQSGNVSIRTNGAFDLHSDCFVKLVNCYRNCTINDCYKGENVRYLVDLTDSNYNCANKNGAFQLKLDTDCNFSELSPNALFALDKNKYDLLTNIGCLQPCNGANYQFDYAEINENGNYVLKGVDELDPDFDGACYIKKVCYSPSVLLLILDMNEYGKENTGRFYLEWFDKNNKRLGYKIVNPSEGWKCSAGSSYIKRIPIYFSQQNEVAFIKYGFVNLEKTLGIGEEKALQLRGFKVFVGYDSPVCQWNDNRNLINDEKYSFGLINNNMISSGTNKPSYRYYNKGSVVFNSNPSSGAVLGWICIEGGNPGKWRTFGVID